MAVRQADSGTYAMPPSYPRDAPDVRKSRLLALAGGGALILVCALVMCLLRVENHGNVDWNAALEMSLLSAGLTGALSLGAYAACSSAKKAWRTTCSAAKRNIARRRRTTH